MLKVSTCFSPIVVGNDFVDLPVHIKKTEGGSSI